MPHRPIRSVIENQVLLTAPAHITVLEAAQKMQHHDICSVVVINDSGQMIGIFTERDALFRVLAKGLDPENVLIRDVMTPSPLSISPDKSLCHALHMMYEGGFRHVPVVEQGRPIGIVSTRDALGSDLLEFEGELVQREYISEVMR